GRPQGDIYGYVNQGMYTVDDFEYTNGVWVLKDGIADSSPITGSAVRPGSPRFAKISDDDPTKIPPTT
ncbi:MAG: hypothetical protein K2I43_05140, partial [Alistipes sp.]|nr:hypothetical protein [Alistipes sp.]